MHSHLRQLSVDERIRLAEDLWDSIASDQHALPLTSTQKAELDKRINAYEATSDPGWPFSEVIDEIRKRL